MLAPHATLPGNKEEEETMSSRRIGYLPHPVSCEKKKKNKKTPFVLWTLSSLGIQLLQRIRMQRFKAVLSFPVGMVKGEKRAGEVPAQGHGTPTSKLTPEPTIRSKNQM